MSAHSALIHEFAAHGPPSFDDEGDAREGFYYQFIDQNELPVGGLIGPYGIKEHAERAAQNAFRAGDF